MQGPCLGLNPDPRGGGPDHRTPHWSRPPHQSPSFHSSHGHRRLAIGVPRGGGFGVRWESGTQPCRWRRRRSWRPQQPPWRQRPARRPPLRLLLKPRLGLTSDNPSPPLRDIPVQRIVPSCQICSHCRGVLSKLGRCSAGPFLNSSARHLRIFCSISRKGSQNQ